MKYALAIAIALNLLAFGLFVFLTCFEMFDGSYRWRQHGGLAVATAIAGFSLAYLAKAHERARPADVGQ